MSKKAKEKEEPLTIGEFAKLWCVPPWVAQTRLRQLEMDGVMRSVNVERDFIPSNEEHDDKRRETVRTRAVTAFELIN